MIENHKESNLAPGFFENVAEIIDRARHNVKTAVNLSMVYAYFEIGRMIVEEDQQGADRAAYGTQLLKELSAYLTSAMAKVFLPTISN